MPRITPVRWQVLECIFKKAGFSFERQSGDHKVYSKEGIHRPVIIPTYKEVRLAIIKSKYENGENDQQRIFSIP